MKTLQQVRMGRLNMRQSFIEVLHSSADERRALFSAAASDLETRAENIEKDLYVCWALDFLFNRRRDDAIGLYFRYQPQQGL
jgi:hypothetical protein